MNREDILALEDLKTESVFIPEWDAAMTVREMTAADRDAYDSTPAVVQIRAEMNANGGQYEAVTPAAVTRARVEMIVRTVVNGDGGLMFKPEDAAKLEGKNSRAIAVLAGAAMRLNRIGGGQIEEAAKNS